MIASSTKVSLNNHGTLPSDTMTGKTCAAALQCNPVATNKLLDVLDVLQDMHVVLHVVMVCMCYFEFWLGCKPWSEYVPAYAQRRVATPALVMCSRVCQTWYGILSSDP
jgi:hypothetical protein